MFKDNFIWLMAGDLGAKWLGQKKGLQTEQEENPMLQPFPRVNLGNYG